MDLTEPSGSYNCFRTHLIKAWLLADHSFFIRSIHRRFAKDNEPQFILYDAVPVSPANPFLWMPGADIHSQQQSTS